MKPGLELTQYTVVVVGVFRGELRMNRERRWIK